MRHVWFLLPLLLAARLYAMGDVIEVDPDGIKLRDGIHAPVTTAKDTVHTEKDTVHGEADMVHAPLTITSNGNVSPDGITGIRTLTISNNGKPFVTNDGKPLMSITNEGKPLWVISNEGKPLFLITNDGKPLFTFDTHGQPLVKVDMGPVGKTVDNAIYIVVIAFVFVLVLLGLAAFWYLDHLYKNYHVTRKISDPRVVYRDPNDKKED